MADYEFRYSPLTGRLTGKQMIEQTEQAINQLSSLVDSAAGQVEIISTLANEANENAATALETAEEALATTGRTYLTVSTQTDANNYYDSQLIYIADSTSTNIPVADTGMLEVKTNDNKTACEQVFIAASSGDAYYRNGAITAETVGDVTTYTVTWGGWSSKPASQQYVQEELVNYAPLASLDNYLPLSGGTVSGDLAVTGDITGNLTGNVTGLASGNLPLTGGTITNSIEFVDNSNNAAGYVWENGWGINIASDGTGGSDKGAWMTLNSRITNSVNQGNELGNIVFTANDGVDSSTLIGRPSGSLTWGGEEIERVNSSGTNYIRYENGIQICWGTTSPVTTNAGTSTTTTVTFPVAFKDATYTVTFVDRFGANAWANHTISTNSYTTTKVGLYLQNNAGGTYTYTLSWMAVGFWK